MDLILFSSLFKCFYISKIEHFAKSPLPGAKQLIFKLALLSLNWMKSEETNFVYMWKIQEPHESVEEPYAPKIAWHLLHLLQLAWSHTGVGWFPNLHPAYAASQPTRLCCSLWHKLHIQTEATRAACRPLYSLHSQVLGCCLWSTLLTIRPSAPAASRASSNSRVSGLPLAEKIWKALLWVQLPIRIGISVLGKVCT